MSDLRRLLRPRSIAIVGLSAEPTKHGQRVVASMRKVGFGGEILGVHPSGADVAGVLVVASLADLPVPPDVVVSAVPAAAVPDVARQAAEVGANAMIVFAGGFAEAGSAGRSMQDDLTAVADETSLRILGPNSGGVIVPGAGVAMSFLTCLDRPAHEIRSGPVGIVTQSGGTGSYLHNLAAGGGGGLAASISTGNEVDIDVADGIAALAEMSEVGSIGVVLETVRNGDRFVEAVRHAGRHDTPVVVTRLGRSDVGQQMMKSHTGALARSDRVLESMLESLGVEIADTPAEMLDMAEIVARTTRPSGDRVGIVTHSGGMAILLRDLAESTDLSFPAPSDALVDEVAPLVQQGSVANPLDMGGIIGGPGRFVETVDAFASSGDFDAVLAVSSAHPRAHSAERAESLVALKSDVPVVHLWMAGDVGAEGLDRLRQAFLPHTEEPRAAIRALAAMCRRPAPFAAETERVAADMATGQPSTEFRAKTLLNLWGVPVVEHALAKDASEAVACADRLGYPVVLKVSSPDILHKTEVGGVRLGLHSSKAVAAAVDEMRHDLASTAPNATVEGLLVERQVSGVEMLIGAVRDQIFGPMVMVGMGGVAVAAFNDVVMVPAGVEASYLARKIEQLRSGPLLTHPRIGTPAEVAALAAHALVLGKLVTDTPSIASVEVNPIVWAEGRWVALDAAIEPVVP
ncbi:MAG: acetate--CoA ligase family protein [Acidimicrobiales bacterium]